MRRVLVLRPEPGASATLERLRERGIEAVAAPLFEIDPVAWEAPEPSEFDALLLTSANAIRFGGAELDPLKSLPVYAVGEATAEAARASGFAVAAVGDGGAERLLAMIDPKLKLLHLCGADRTVVDHHTQEITSLTIYGSRPIETPDLSRAAGSVALIHSPRAGRLFAELVADRGSIAIAAISQAAADAAGSGWQAIEVAVQPREEGLLALAASLCNKPAPE